MDRSEIENVSPEVEMLARMWIQCDPNRGDNADESWPIWVDGKSEDHPRWKWFIPRAQASLGYFKENGFALSRSTEAKKGAVG